MSYSDIQFKGLKENEDEERLAEEEESALNAESLKIILKNIIDTHL
jgi:hypothetical protein